MYDVIIIGSGPSGMSTAIYTQRSGLKTLVIEKGMYGGQLNNTLEIENYIGVGKVSGMELSDSMNQQMESFGVESVYGDVISVTKEGDLFVVVTDSDSYVAKSVVVATGTQHRKLGVEGEETYNGRGVSYCAVCDGAFFKNANIHVVGGGDSALEEGEYLTNFGSNITLIHRRDTFRATPILQNRFLNKDNTSTILKSQVSKIIGDGTKVTYLEIVNDLNQKEKIASDAVFIYVGANPNTSFLDKSLLDSEGYLITNEHLETSIKGLFGSGDVRSGSKRQVATAVGDGAVCGLEIYKYILETK